MAEKIKDIIEWQEKTFPDATLEGQIKKFYAERDEWYKSGSKDTLELADMFIVACGIARFSTATALDCFSEVMREANYAEIPLETLEKAIENKAIVNRSRTWNFENGQYQHKEE